ncbi:hypothetical protein [Nocardia sp. R6R-6]|uniref:hypothetical protein n=1 Tax=Nocardia sp. R6R-6 TaxID=3459303 RepID=UPI00403DBBD2
MSGASQPDIDRWELRSRDCTLGIVIEGQEHARYVLSVHSGHGGECRPFQDALSAVSVAMG